MWKSPQPEDLKTAKSTNGFFLGIQNKQHNDINLYTVEHSKIMLELIIINSNMNIQRSEWSALLAINSGQSFIILTVTSIIDINLHNPWWGEQKKTKPVLFSTPKITGQKKNT